MRGAARPTDSHVGMRQTPSSAIEVNQVSRSRATEPVDIALTAPCDEDMACRPMEAAFPIVRAVAPTDGAA